MVGNVDFPTQVAIDDNDEVTNFMFQGSNQSDSQDGEVIEDEAYGITFDDREGEMVLGINEVFGGYDIPTVKPLQVGLCIVVFFLFKKRHENGYYEYPLRDGICMHFHFFLPKCDV